MTKHNLYPDEGCDKAKKLGYFGSCLECPFDECLEVGDVYTHLPRKQRRNENIMQDYHNGMTRKELAEKYRTSERTIRRAIDSFKRVK
ncbi:hypothetical protein ES703_112338 [subsurface metagenome]